MLRRWFHRVTVILGLRSDPMDIVLLNRTLLVDNDLLLDALQIQAREAFLNARIIDVLPDNPGTPASTLVKVALSEADYAAILAADRFANTHGEEPEISVTEYDTP